MVAEDILTELQDIMRNRRISKNDLMVILKKYAGIISAYDLMIATARMRKDGEYIQSQYREKYLKIYIKHFIMRMKEVRENNDDMESEIDITSLKNSFHLLELTFEKEIVFPFLLFIKYCNIVITFSSLLKFSSVTFISL